MNDSAGANKMFENIRGRYNNRTILALFLIAIISVACYLTLDTADWSPTNLWLTPDQQGDHMMKREKYTEAAERYIEPFRRGEAFYRAGEFKKAAIAFGQDDSAEAFFNRGNVLILLGKYDEAIASYQHALQIKPAWKKAMENQAIAKARKENLTPPDDDHGGTGGKLEADEIVFDDRPMKSSNEDQEIEVGGGDALSDEEMRSLWLRRVETRPADFLRVKFAYQQSRKQKEASSP